jgi:hypothetical protein
VRGPVSMAEAFAVRRHVQSEISMISAGGGLDFLCTVLSSTASTTSSPSSVGAQGRFTP